MDRVSQADAVLAAALAYSPAAVIPGHAPSPMDCDTTIRVTRTVVGACDLRAREASSPAPTLGEQLGRPRPDDAPPDPVLDEEMVRASRGRGTGNEVGRTA
jgi:hypothetical protein